MPDPVFSKTQTLYEVLLRFDEAGALKGVHAQYLSVVKEDGKVISAVPGQAVPLSLVDEGDKATLKAALGEAAVALIEAKEAAEAAVTEVAMTKDAIIQDLMSKVPSP